MITEEFPQTKERSEREVFVISRTDDGFCVYSPAEPAKSYVVSGSPESPSCSCPDFQYHQGDLGWRCKHILAVLNQLARRGSSPQQADPYDRQERPAIQNESRPEQEKIPSNGSSQMVIKRSVSPDGRIDSLSVEFALPVDRLPVADVKAKAERTLLVQAEIVKRFLAANGSKSERKTTASGEPMPAEMLGVGGMNGKWGRRLFINVESDGRMLKLFGNRKELAEHIAAAGFPEHAHVIEEGAALRIPCRVVTRPSADGRFLDIVKVLPAGRGNRL